MSVGRELQLELWSSPSLSTMNCIKARTLLVFCLVSTGPLLQLTVCVNADSIDVPDMPVWVAPGSFELKVQLSTLHENPVAGVWVLVVRGPKADRRILYEGLRAIKGPTERFRYTTATNIPERDIPASEGRQLFLLCVWLSEQGSSFTESAGSQDWEFIWREATARNCYPLRNPFANAPTPLLSGRRWSEYRSLSWPGKLIERGLLLQVCKRSQGQLLTNTVVRFFVM